MHICTMKMFSYELLDVNLYTRLIKLDWVGSRLYHNYCLSILLKIQSLHFMFYKPVLCPDSFKRIFKDQTWIYTQFDGYMHCVFFFLYFFYAEIFVEMIVAYF